MSDMQNIKSALSDLSKTLESLVVAPPVVSIPAMRARYQIVLIKEMLDWSTTYRQFTERTSEWDKKNNIKG